ncbi:MAG: PilW family protein [Candidatus Dormibacterales bacterium]
MKAVSRRHSNQAGFTLVELLVALVIAVFVASALTSVILTSVRASNIAIGRIEASEQIRTFELRAHDDFASSRSPVLNGCGTQQSNPCHTQPIVLNGFQVTNSNTPAPSPTSITYQWDGSANLDRQVGSSSIHMATNVGAFSWYVDPASHTVVVQMTVTVLAYSESQTLLFYPRVSG